MGTKDRGQLSHAPPKQISKYIPALKLRKGASPQFGRHDSLASYSLATYTRLRKRLVLVKFSNSNTIINELSTFVSNTTILPPGTQFNNMNPIRSLSSLRPNFNPQATISIRTFTTAPSLHAVQKNRQLSSKEKDARIKAKKKRKKHTTYKMPDLKVLKMFSLCDAMQYIRACEVGRDTSIPKYDLAIRLKTKKDGPVLRNQIRLPHSVKTDIKVCVICPPNSKEGRAAKEAGASLVGDEEVFDIIKNGKIDFDRCITTPAMLPIIQKAGIPRILGPRGLMPSVKLGTVTDNIAVSVQNTMGGSTYRERQGVIRMAVGQLGFSPEMLRDNVKAFTAQIKKEASTFGDTQNITKEVFEVVCLQNPQVHKVVMC